MATKRKTKAESPPAEPLDRVIDAAMERFAGRGWRNVALQDIAQASGLTLGQLYLLCPSKTAILRAFLRRIDRATLGKDGETDASPRDRLFELMMRRFDALGPYKAALRAIMRDLPSDPPAAAMLACAATRSLAWIAEAAGIETGGWRGMLIVKGLAAVYGATFVTWLNDEGEHAKTMAALDRNLKRAEMLANSLPLRPRSRPVAA